MLQLEKYPHLEWFSKETGITENDLIKGFELEKAFHEKIMTEKNIQNRKTLYSDLYRVLVPLYETTHNPQIGPVSKFFIVNMFRNELAGKSILDVGCGAGNFLMCVSDNLNNKILWGIDLFIPDKHKFNEKKYSHIHLKESDIIDFSLDKEFDIVFSDSVMEHMAPPDLSIHLKAINKALKKDGMLIAILPNRLFGPSDVTRIIDNSHKNKLPALGSHLSESTYSEFLPLLRQYGFGHFKTTIQLPILHRTLYKILNQVRVSPAIYAWIEKKPRILNLLYKIRGQNSYGFMITMFVICKKIRAISTLD